MYKCLDCGVVFVKPYHYFERHGLETPPYEEMWVCPICGGAYDELVECDRCGEVVLKRDAFRVNIPFYPNAFFCAKCHEEAVS